jgi:2-keto-myo-inositol isomerase
MDKVESMLKERSITNTRDRLYEQGLPLASVNGPENFNLLDERAFSAILERTDKIVEAAREFYCKLLIPVPSPSRDGVSEQVAIAQTASALSQMADRYGDEIELGLEFLGMRSCSINNLQAAVETIRRVDRRNVGLVLDSFHMHLSDSKFSQVGELDADKVFLVHVNDAETGDRLNLTDANRLFPGEGVIDLKTFASVLKEIGYDNRISLELLRPEYWEQDPEQVAVKGRKSLRLVFGV